VLEAGAERSSPLYPRRPVSSQAGMIRENDDASTGPRSARQQTITNKINQLTLSTLALHIAAPPLADFSRT
jgi:hypothetical protein